MTSLQIPDSTEKATTPPEPEPAAAGQKCKEGPSKDKKATAELNKQKSHKQNTKEPALCAEPAVAETNSLTNGDKSQKRPERRRQSLGGFFKGLVSRPFVSPSSGLRPEVRFLPPKGTDRLGDGRTFVKQYLSITC